MTKNLDIDKKPFSARSHLPTNEFPTRYEAAIQKHVSKLKRAFSLSREDAEDLWQDIVLDLLSIPISLRGQKYYVLKCVANAAVDSIRRITGKRPSDSQSQRQRTVYFEEHLHDDSSSALCHLISRATTVPSPDYDQNLMLNRVRHRLNPATLELFDWVLKEPKHNHGDLVRYCRKELNMSADDISTARLEIVEAMHVCGLALNYPPPAIHKQKRMRRTAVERLHWLQGLVNAGYTRVSEAAQAAGLTPYAVNWHCRKYHGCNYNEFVARSKQ